MALSVELEPVPAMTGTRPAACWTTMRITSSVSSWESVGLSPVVPVGTSPSTFFWIWKSTSLRSAFSSTRFPSGVNGVTRAVKTPLYMAPPPCGGSGARIERLPGRIKSTALRIEACRRRKIWLGWNDRSDKETSRPW